MTSYAHDAVRLASESRTARSACSSSLIALTVARTSSMARFPGSLTPAFATASRPFSRRRSMWSRSSDSLEATLLVRVVSRELAETALRQRDAGERLPVRIEVRLPAGEQVATLPRLRV